MKEIDNRLILRENFGPGRAGEIAYLTVLQGIACEVIDKQNLKCEKTSDRTIGFDVLADYQIIPVCSREHAVLAMEKVIVDLSKSGRTPSFDENGFGRA